MFVVISEKNKNRISFNKHKVPTQVNIFIHSNDLKQAEGQHFGRRGKENLLEIRIRNDRIETIGKCGTRTCT